jgi:hypothetical protein
MYYPGIRVRDMRNTVEILSEDSQYLVTSRIQVYHYTCWFI